MFLKTLSDEMIVEVGFTDPNTKIVSCSGNYVCPLHCSPGDFCRVHDAEEGYRVGKILKILAEDEKEETVSVLSDVFEVTPVRNGISGVSISIYPKTEFWKKTASRAAKRAGKTKIQSRGHHEISENNYTIFGDDPGT